MIEAKKIALIGHGSTAMSALEALVDGLIKSSEPIGPVEITIFGKNWHEREENAHDAVQLSDEIKKIAARRGWLDSIITNPETIGLLCLRNPEQQLEEENNYNINIKYDQQYVGDIEHEYGKPSTYNLVGIKDSAIVDTIGFHYVALAIGNTWSPRFDAAIKKFPRKVFTAPRHALRCLDNDAWAGKTVLAYSVGASSIDSVLSLTEHGAHVICMSPSGAMPWPANESRTPYPLKILTDKRVHRKCKDIQECLYRELEAAQREGAYIPQGILNSLREYTPQKKSIDWHFNYSAEIEAAQTGRRTYHDVILAINWEKQYTRLEDHPDEAAAFLEKFSDFIMYNRADVIKLEDCLRLYKAMDDKKVQIINGRIKLSDLSQRNNNKKIFIQIENTIVIADYVIDCTMRPASAKEQVNKDLLIKHLVEKRWLYPRNGTGFNKSVVCDQITLLGAQGRYFPFSEMSSESYAKRARLWAEKLCKELEQEVRKKRKKELMRQQKSAQRKGLTNG